MKPIELWNGDCLELMKNIPDGTVDLVLTDPPYGKKADKGTNGFGSAKNRKYGGGWDNKQVVSLTCQKFYAEQSKVVVNINAADELVGNRLEEATE